MKKSFIISSLAFGCLALAIGLVLVQKVDVLGFAVAGFVVGIGTRYGGGCTSGHGICGMARLSPRSIVATGSFVAAGMATVFVLRHLVRLPS